MDDDNLPPFLPTTPPSRFSFGLGVGMTFMRYRETGLVDIALNELGVTPKANLGLILIPGTLDLGVNGFFTAVPAYWAPSDLESFRVFAANGRIAYTLPIQWGGASYSLATGWYFWNLRSSNRTFGLDMLSGPQLLFTVRKAFSTRRSALVYFKFAPIADQGISAANREIAAGTAIQLPFFDVQRRFSLTLDFAEAKFSTADDANTMKLVSGTLGFSFAL